MRARSLTHACLIALAASSAMPASSRAQGAARLTDVTGVEWLLTNDQVADAAYVGAVAADKSAGGTHLSLLADAFDGYGEISVSVDGGGATPFSTGWAGATECGGRQLVLPVQNIGGIAVTRKLYVPTDDGFARWLTVLQDTSGTAHTVTLTVSGNLGSDARTTIGATSDGNTVASAGDSWVVTYGSFVQEGSREPRLAHVLSSPGAAVQPTAVQFADGDDTPAWAYQLSVPAGGSVAVLYFAAAQQTVMDAGLQAARLAALPAPAVACLSQVEQSQVSNLVPGIVPSAPLQNGPASITITSPTMTSNFAAGGPFLSVGGVAGTSGLTSVSWTNSRGGSGVALGLGEWVIPSVTLQSGANVITVTANYTGGAKLVDTVTVQLDQLTYLLPEGAVSSFFATDLLLANPGSLEAEATVTFLTGTGGKVTLPPMTLSPTSRTTVSLNSVPGLVDVGAVSTLVTTATTTPLVVERTMFWDTASSYGSHGATALDGPRTTFLFGEGSQGFFDTYVLLANAGTKKADVTVQFFREGESTITRSYQVEPTSRFTVFAGVIPELASRSFSMAIQSTEPITAERAMYFGTPLFNGGHDSPGASVASPQWYFAEGASGSFFDTYFLLGNPTGHTANVTLTFLLPNGSTVVSNRTVAPYGRTTVFADAENPALVDTAFSLKVTSSAPITAERSMYWAGTSATWYEAHNAFGVLEPASKWGLAEGRVGTDRAFESFILIGNDGETDSDVRVTFLRADGGTVARQYTVLAKSRFNLFVNAMVPELVNEEFGAVVEVLKGSPVTVERSLYHSAGGVQFRGGTSTPAMRLP